MVQHVQINQYDIPYNKMKDKIYIISVNTEKAFDQIQHPLMMIAQKSG